MLSNKFGLNKAQGLRDSIEENLDSGKSYKYFVIFFAIGWLFLFLSCMFLFVLSIHKFSLLFSVGSICMLVSMAFYRGPATYTKRLFRKDQALFSIWYLVSLFMTLYMSLIWNSTIMTMVACSVQVSLTFYSNLYSLIYSYSQCFGSYDQGSQEARTEWKAAHNLWLIRSLEDNIHAFW